MAHSFHEAATSTIDSDRLSDEMICRLTNDMQIGLS